MCHRPTMFKSHNLIGQRMRECFAQLFLRSDHGEWWLNLHVRLGANFSQGCCLYLVKPAYVCFLCVSVELPVCFQYLKKPFSDILSKAWSPWISKHSRRHLGTICSNYKDDNQTAFMPTSGFTVLFYYLNRFKSSCHSVQCNIWAPRSISSIQFQFYLKDWL